MNLNIPPAIKDMSPTLQEFFEAMVHKLNVNSHKNAIRDDDIDGLLEKLADEIEEFRQQRLQDASDPNILMELADTGNFAFLLYAYLRSKGVQDLKEQFIDEFYSVDVEGGKIFCKKTRSGSPLKLGDEVKGTERNGVVYIRAQHTASGAAIYLQRREIVWWKRHGEWPNGKLQHIIKAGNLKDSEMIDAWFNLSLIDPPPVKTYPHVSRYAPKGREEAENWGKYVYQRRHKLKLVRVGYWDTQEEAAVEGLKRWKEITSNV